MIENNHWVFVMHGDLEKSSGIFMMIENREKLREQDERDTEGDRVGLSEREKASENPWMIGMILWSYVL